MFKKLEKYRISPNREFFKCDTKIIKEEMNNIEKLFETYTDEELINLYFTYKNKYSKQHIININNITDDMYLYLINKKELSYDEELMIIKYKYSKQFGCPIENIDDAFMKKYYGKLYVADNHKKFVDYLHNIHHNDITDEKMIHLKKILYHFGFNEVNKKITKDYFYEKNKEINDILCDSFCQIFNIKQNKINDILKDASTNKKILGYINTLLKNYGLIIRGCSKKIYNKITKKRYNIWEYILIASNIVV